MHAETPWFLQTMNLCKTSHFSIVRLTSPKIARFMAIQAALLQSSWWLQRQASSRVSSLHLSVRRCDALFFDFLAAQPIIPTVFPMNIVKKRSLFCRPRHKAGYPYS